jgi:hypothetical protein
MSLFLGKYNAYDNSICGPPESKEKGGEGVPRLPAKGVALCTPIDEARTSQRDDSNRIDTH